MKKTIVEKIRSVASPVSIVLFGSQVYGDPGDNSDLDIFVLEHEVKSKIDEVNKMIIALKDIPIAKDIVVASENEYAFYRKEAGSIYKTISEKGEVIFG